LGGDVGHLCIYLIDTIRANFAEVADDIADPDADL
jgi:hypothetical protein